MRFKTRRELHLLLQSTECKEFILKKLAEHLDWREILAPILPIKNSSFSQYCDEETKVIIEEVNAYYYDDFIKSQDDSYKEEDRKPKEPDIYDKFRICQRQGVIAGGAIAAWVNEFINQVPAVINDIDWWLIDYSEVGEEETEIKEHMYSNLEAEESGYDIVNVKEEGILNTIQIDPASLFSWSSLVESFDLTCSQIAFNPYNQELTYSIDFLDFLITRELRLSEDHAVGAQDWPLTSIVRAQIKAKEMDAKFKIHEVMNEFILNKLRYKTSYSIFSTGAAVVRDTWSALKQPIPLYCKDHKEKFRLLLGVKPDSLADNFHNIQSCDVEVISEKRLKVWQCNPRLLLPWIELSEGGMRLADSCFSQDWTRFLKDPIIANDDYEFYLNEFGSQLFKKEKSIGKLDYLSLSPDKKAITHSFNRSTHHFNRILNIIKSNIFVVKEKYGNQKIETLTQSFKNLYTTYTHIFTTDPIAGGLEVISKFQKEHSVFLASELNYYLVSQLKYSINDLIYLYKHLSKIDLTFIGVLESMLPSSNSRFHSPFFLERHERIIPLFVNKNFRELESFLKEEYIKQLKKDFMVEPLNLKPYWQKYVRELNLASQLILESDKMNHCVRGYAGKVKDGQARIFHLKIGRIESTLELRPEKTIEKVKIKKVSNKTSKQNPRPQLEIILNNGFEATKPKLRSYQKSAIMKIVGKNPRKKLPPKFTIAQHKTFNNGTPDKTLQRLALRLVAYLNNYNS